MTLDTLPLLTFTERKGSWELGWEKKGAGEPGRRSEERVRKKSTRVSLFLFSLSLWHEKTMAFLRHSADKAALKKTNGHD